MAGYLAPSPRARILARVFLGQMLVGWLGAALLFVDGGLGGFLQQAAMWNLWVCVPTAVVTSLVLLATPLTAMRWSWWQAAVVVVLGPLVPTVIWHEQGGGGIADYLMMAAATALGVFLGTRRLLLRGPSGMDAHQAGSQRGRAMTAVFRGQLLAAWLLIPSVGLFFGGVPFDPDGDALWWELWLYRSVVATVLFLAPVCVLAALLLVADWRIREHGWTWLHSGATFLLVVLLLWSLDSRPVDLGEFGAILVLTAWTLPGLLAAHLMLNLARSRAAASGGT